MSFTEITLHAQLHVSYKLINITNFFKLPQHDMETHQRQELSKLWTTTNESIKIGLPIGIFHTRIQLRRRYKKHTTKIERKKWFEVEEIIGESMEWVCITPDNVFKWSLDQQLLSRMLESYKLNRDQLAPRHIQHALMNCSAIFLRGRPNCR